MEIPFLFIGLVGLWFGAELTVNGAIDIARRYNFSHAFVGLTILSVGTDVPELFIMVTGSIQQLGGADVSGLLVGEVIGSSFSQISLVAGLAALVVTLTITEKRMVRDGAALLGSVILVFLLSFDGVVTQIEGFVLLLVYAMYFVFLLRGEKVGPRFHGKAKRPMLQSVMLLIAGLLMLHFASDVTITNALGLSERFGIAQSLIGILVVGLGTSLPELATAVNAGKNEAGSMAVGNLIGSTVFDLLFVFGLGAGIHPLIVSSRIRFFDIPYLFVAAALLIALMAKNSDRLSKREGLVLVGVALLYGLLTFSDLLVRGFGLAI
jgi:cation:H+ antiporter